MTTITKSLVRGKYSMGTLKNNKYCEQKHHQQMETNEIVRRTSCAL
jgi:hypothetical protein